MLWQRFAFRLGAKFVENLSQSPNAERELKVIILNDIVKLADQSGGFFIGKFKVHSDRQRHFLREKPMPRTITGEASVSPA
jgi:hypothetical protein